MSKKARLLLHIKYTMKIGPDFLDKYSSECKLSVIIKNIKLPTNILFTKCPRNLAHSYVVSIYNEN